MPGGLLLKDEENHDFLSQVTENLHLASTVPEFDCK